MGSGKYVGLNRTMQYGNTKNPDMIKRLLKFKSYYVVWKLKYLRLSESEKLCLNRTMQYGNFPV